MSPTNNYPTLFSPAKIGSLELANRVVLAPMATNYADEQHRVTDRLIAYHVARAAGGVGLNIVEHTAVHKLGLTAPRMLGIMDDSFIPGLRRLTDAVHEAGGKIALQIQHGGRQADPQTIGQQCLSPSAVVAGRDRRMPREMTVKEIRDTVRAFAEGAGRAKAAGFDGVEVHMAHGYLGCSFLSPLLNLRTDAYGGDPLKRTRFAYEVLDGIRRRCGAGFPVWARISADEYIEGGQRPEGAQAIARLLAEYGYDAIHVSAAIGETGYYASAPYLLPEGHLLHLAEGIARRVQVPVIGVGNIRHPQFAEDALLGGRCTLVALGRQLLADPDWANKAREGHAQDIIPCILCNQGCGTRDHSPEGFTECLVNPWTAHEVDWPDWPDGPPASPARRVLVVGAGPAGATAAAVAARRGHEVHLWERGPVLGGRVAAIAWPDRSGVLEELMDSMAGALDAAGVRVAWQQPADADSIARLAPDVVIMASGADPADPNRVLPEGCEGPYVQGVDYLQDADMPFPELVAVLGADRVGTLSAIELARRGHEVLLFEREEQIARSMPTAIRHFLLRRIETSNIRVMTGCRVENVRDGVVTALVRGEERREFPQAGIVSALGRTPRALPEGLQERLGAPVYQIGDCKFPRSLHDAVWEGADIARKI